MMPRGLLGNWNDREESICDVVTCYALEGVDVRPGGGRKAQAAVIADVMREADARALAGLMHRELEAAVAEGPAAAVQPDVFSPLGCREARKS